MATDIITSKIYKLLGELNIPNEDISLRPDLVQKIIDLCFSSTIKSKVTHASTDDDMEKWYDKINRLTPKSKLVDSSKKQSSKPIIQHIDYWIDDSVASIKEVLYCVQEKMNEIIDYIQK